MSSALPIPIAGIPSKLGATLETIFIGATKAAVFVRNLSFDAMLAPSSRFYGITISQTVVYYKQNPNGPWLFRYAVAFLWIFDTLHVALSTRALYFYLIESFGIIWSFPVTLFPRFVSLHEPKALPISCSYCSIDSPAPQTVSSFLYEHTSALIFDLQFLTVAATFGTGSYVIYDTYTLSSFMDVSTIRASIYADFSTVAGADFVIAGAMCFYLHKGLSFIPRSMNVLMQLIKYYQHNFETNAARSDIRAGDEA
ncbi:hypothetical protein ARMGADRAFT_1031279 [Armillaria gallica]|uniref:Uncharacterized protein n=1 Tax=Armillaria gallica TaxID=47427 RepID=A0A2H3DCE4_ARMGA|nr:hypothetical protein ARMGADRAFT_1031279 [Armillaria gallica]